MHAISKSRNQAGFTVIELLLTLSVIGALGTITAQAFYNWLPRLDLRVAAQQSRALVSKARLVAIQRGVRTVVEADPAAGVLRAYADVNGDPVAGNPGHVSYLVYDPDLTAGEKQTDFEIGQVQLEGATFGGSLFAPTDGFTTSAGAPAGTSEVLVFSPAGVPGDLGAFRLADTTDRNVFEVAIASLAGRVETRKYLLDKDSPTASAGFFAEGQDSNGQTLWTWY
ncbi:MAG: prepilin-type N-terminal cleavage/methylation domain-containing protein [Acidobacteriota bacterium]